MMESKDTADIGLGFGPGSRMAAENERRKAIDRLSEQLLSMNTPEQLARIAAEQTLYADSLQKKLLEVLEECAKRPTVEVAAKYAYLATRAFVSYQAKGSVSARRDQILKPNWIAHCKAVIASGQGIETLDDLLQLQGYDPEITTIQSATLRKWARSVGIKFKAGRKKTKQIAI